MTKFRIAALAAGLLLQSLARANGAGSSQTVDRAAEQPVYSLTLDDVQGGECNPEDDCPRPASSQQK
jgi:hypothetical protein